MNREQLLREIPTIMGVLNVTPDSFSDGGRYLDTNAAIEAGFAMSRAGAAIVDVGGESTRPGAQDVPAEEELSRVLPVVEALAKRGITVSIDTRKAAVADAALKAGARIVNDVSGFRDPAMRRVAAEHDASIIIMHMQGTPQTMQVNPHYEDVVSEVLEFLVEQAEQCMAAGIARERIWIDPGIGFGKALDHNLTLLRHLPKFVATRYPVLLGASRKSFIAHLTGESDPTKRLPGSVAAALWGARCGVKALRVHDVEETLQALLIWQALDGGARLQPV
ncbi:MAG: dihydropteroate synthase [Fimbriimonadales bacterium]|nr:MAG: dihydropteroate synthase [Fimbriimonadales bacterium]